MDPKKLKIETITQEEWDKWTPIADLTYREMHARGQCFWAGMSALAVFVGMELDRFLEIPQTFMTREQYRWAMLDTFAVQWEDDKWRLGLRRLPNVPGWIFDQCCLIYGQWRETLVKPADEIGWNANESVN